MEKWAGYKNQKKATGHKKKKKIENVLRTCQKSLKCRRADKYVVVPARKRTNELSERESDLQGVKSPRRKTVPANKGKARMHKKEC